MNRNIIVYALITICWIIVSCFNQRQVSRAVLKMPGEIISSYPINQFWHLFNLFSLVSIWVSRKCFYSLTKEEDRNAKRANFQEVAGEALTQWVSLDGDSEGNAGCDKPEGEEGTAGKTSVVTWEKKKSGGAVLSPRLSMSSGMRRGRWNWIYMWLGTIIAGSSAAWIYYNGMK